MENLIQYCTQDSLYDGPFDSQVGWKAAGMGYVIKTANGKLIAIDGGNRNDAEGFLSLLEEYADGGRPEIDLWIITHPHSDHYYALLEMCKSEEMRSRFKVNRILYHFPTEFRAKSGVLYCTEHNRNMEEILAATGAEAYTPQVDEKIALDGVELHFLYTPTDCSILNNPNQLSLIFTVQGTAKKVMITGDAFDRNLQIVLWRYDTALKCDILQMPHHGLCDTGNAKFYTRVGADTILIPTSIAGYRAMHSEMYAEQALKNNAVEEAAQAVYKAFEGTAAIEI